MTRAIIDERDSLRRTVARQDALINELSRTKRQHQRAILDELADKMDRNGYADEACGVRSWTELRLSE